MKKHQLMDSAGEVKGAGGGGGKKQSARTPVEAPNTLQAFVRGRILDLIAFGPIKGLVNGLKSVYLDSTPVQNADDSYNFEGVTLEFRNGTPDQDVIPGFRAVENTSEINTAVLFDNPPVRALTNVDADAIAITVQLAGLARQEDNGDVVAHAVSVMVDISDNGGAWQQVFATSINGKTTSAYPQTYRIDLPDTDGPFSVRVRRGNKESDSDRVRDALTWTLLTEIIDQPFSYPNMAMAGISVNSKLFGSSMPARSYDVYLSVVKVPSNYDPETRTYTGLWDGTFKEAWTDNPAWAYYDLATHPIIGAGLINVDKWELYRIGKYCDEMVPDGYGGMEPRFSINTVFSDQEDAYVALSTLASVFRGMTYWGTNTVVPVGDMPTSPSRIVAPANVVDGEFHYVGTSDRERHSVCVAMWNDPENEGKSTPEVYEDADSIAEYGWRETRVTAVGCTSRGQAHRLAKWILYSERMETQTISYKAKLDHATVRPGEIIEVADPDFQGARMAGRLIEGGTTSLVLDKIDQDVITSVGGDWFVSVTMPDQRVEKAEVSSFQGNTIFLVGALTEAPQPGAIWALSSAGLLLPQYRVVSVKEEDDSTYVITATEYDPNKYAYVEYDLKLPERPTSLIPAGPITPPTDLTFEVYKYQAGGSEHQGMVISWKPSKDVRVDSYVLDVKGPSDAAYRTVYVGAGVSFDLRDAGGGEWLIRVRSVAKDIPSQWLMRTVQLQLLLLPTPPDSVDVKLGTLELTLTPMSAYPQALWEFWRSTVALGEGQIETNASYIATGNYLVDTGLKPDTQYFYYIRGTNQYGKSSWYAVQAKTENNFDDILEAVTKDILEGELSQALNEKIDTRAAQVAIDAANQVVNEALTDVNAQLDGLTTGLTDLQTAVGVEVTRINGELSDLQGQITEAINGQTYDKDKAYTAGQFAYIGNSLYQAKVDVPANPDGSNSPPNASYWRDAGTVISSADGLAARVTTTETSITSINGELASQASTITGIQASLNDKADASALTSLASRVTAAEGTITSQGTAITNLTNTVAGKADASALSALSTRVTTAEGTISSQGTAITNLTNSLSGKADASALSALTTRVSTAEGTISSQGTSITNLTNSLAGKADASTVASLSNTVTQQGNTLTAQGTAVTNIQATLGGMGGSGSNLLPSEYSWLGSSLPTMVSSLITRSAVAVAEADSGYGYRLVANDTNIFSYAILAPGNQPASFNLALEPGTYLVSMYIKGDTAGQAMANLYDATTSRTATLNYTTTRTRLTFVIAIPVTTKAALYIYPNRQGASGAAIVVDSVMVEKKLGDSNAPSPYVAGPTSRAVASVAAATQALDARVTTAEGTLTSQGTSITNLTNSLAGKADASALSALTTRVTTAEGLISSQGASLVSLTSMIGQQPDNLILKGTFEDGTVGPWTADPVISNVTAHPSYSKAITFYGNSFCGTTRNIITQGGEQFDCSADIWNNYMSSGQTTRLQIQFYDKNVVNLGYFTAFTCPAGINGFQKYSGRVTAPTGAVTARFVIRHETSDGTGRSLWCNIVARRVSEAETANASATTALTTRVTAAEGTLTSQGSSITSLTNSLAGKADASAVTSLTTRMSAAETAITNQATATTALQTTLGNQGGNGVNLLEDTYSWLTSTTLPATVSSSGVTKAGIAVAEADSGYGISLGGMATLGHFLMLSPTNSTAGRNIRITNGTYLVSMYIVGSAAGSIAASLFGPGGRLSANIPYTTSRTRITLPITVTDIAVDSTPVSLTLYPNRTAVSGLTVTIDSVMVERKIGDSNLPSPFVPGPSARTATAQAAAISSLDTRVTSAEGVNTAQASSITSLTTRMGTAETSITNTASSLASTNGSLTSMWAMKINTSSNGKQYVAGMGVSMITSGGITQSEILFQADRFALINTSNNGVTIPFVIENGVTYINQAMIKAATITNLLVGQTLTSTAQTNWGGPVMATDFSQGLTIIRHPTMANTYTLMNNSGIQVVVSGVLRVRMGVW